MRKNCFFVFDSDSQFIACENVLSGFDLEVWNITFVILGDFEHNEFPESIRVVKIRSVAELFENEIITTETDVLGVYLTGSKLREIRVLTDAFFQANGVRPIIFTGYNGVVLQKFEEGFSWRCGYDLIAMNSEEDRLKAEQFLAYRSPAKQSILPVIGIKRIRLAPQDQQEATCRMHLKQIVFAEQVIFPATVKEKAALYCQLVRIALLNPDWNILIKSRTLPGLKTFHKQDQHISGFLQSYFKLPSNLSITYQSLNELLPNSSALLSVSSTAFFDGLSHSVPSFTISDFGISSAYGTHYFYGSGCMIRLADISVLSPELFQATPSQEWLMLKGFSDELTPHSLVSQIDQLLDSGHRCSELPEMVDEQQLAITPFHIPNHTNFEVFHVKKGARSYPGRKVYRYIMKRIKKYLGLS